MSYKPYSVGLKNGGKATFVYMSMETAQKYEKVLLAMEAAETSGVSADLTGITLGLHQNAETKKWELVKINYSPLTKECKIDTIKEVAVMKKYANSALLRALEELKIL